GMLAGDRGGEGGGGGGRRVCVLCEPLVHVEDPGRKRLSFLRAEQMAVVLQRGAATCRVDDDGSVAGHRVHHYSRQRAGLADETGVHVQGAAAVATPLGQRDTDTRGGEHI